MQNKILDIQKIMHLIPHRYPFLLIDRIISIGEEKIVAIKNVTINEDFFNGHFPGSPVMPGVLILEAMAQAAAVLVMEVNNMSSSGSKEGSPKNLMYLASIENVRFRKPVVPGDRLELHVNKIKARSTLWKFSGLALVDGETVADAVFSAMLVTPDNSINSGEEV
jgi:3-hydroxyacyl-[acyl-carrier-protein] dehydratase